MLPKMDDEARHPTRDLILRRDQREPRRRPPEGAGITGTLLRGCRKRQHLRMRSRVGSRPAA
ncbi:hypothetical protein Maq22A_c28055 [Methylobacterium aquaticum]|uniref:Uncharacterized protein n=1 Tax=Methylobacterium aquaticum TaxID=270351 RepID=A0A1Y0ZCA2_9HYPH|nr:hypothetical protein Maq22A_c28055 [Methylobacterium aquaticum]